MKEACARAVSKVPRRRYESEKPRILRLGTEGRKELDISKYKYHSKLSRGL